MNENDHINQPILSNGRWTSQEHQQFLVGLQLYGRNWKKIQQMLKTRTGSQIRSHAQKFFNKLGKPCDEKTSDGSNEQFLTLKEAQSNQLKLQLHPSFQPKSYYLDEMSKTFLIMNDVSFWQTFIDRKIPIFSCQVSLPQKKSFIPFQEGEKDILTGSTPTKKIKL